MKRDELKKILPHREPMLLIDEAEKIDDTTATGRYTVTGDEFFYRAIFPVTRSYQGSSSAKLWLRPAVSYWLS